MIYRYLACTQEELQLVSQHPRLQVENLQPIQLPITGSSEPIDMLICGSLFEDPLNLAVTVSGWKQPPVTICLFPETATDKELNRVLFNPQVGKSVFVCRALDTDFEKVFADAEEFSRARSEWYIPGESFGEFTIDNVSARWLFECLMRDLDEYIYFKDAQGRFLAVSQYLTQQCGKSLPSEVLGKTDYEFFDSHHSDEAAADERLIAEGKLPELHKEEFLADEEGREKWVLSHKFPLQTRSNFVAGTFGISRDITEEKKLQQQIRRSNSLMKAELKLARNLQQTLIGHDLPSFAFGSRSEPLSIATRYIPSSELSGDFYACRKTPSGAPMFFVADVMGHGVRAAMITAMILICVQQLEHLSDEPEAFMKELNSMIHNSVKPLEETVFATAIFARLDVENLRLDYVQAGAQHGAIVSSAEGRMASLLSDKKIGPALGFFPSNEYAMDSVSVSPKDDLFFYTDGLVETVNEKDEEFGKKRMLKLLEDPTPESWDDRIDRMIAEVFAFSNREVLEDDLCLLGVTIPDNS